MTITKRPGEAFTFTYDFAPYLAGATIATITSATSTPQGNGANLVKQAQAILGATVLVNWADGDDGEEYLTKVLVKASDGSDYEIGGVIAVRALIADGPFGDDPAGDIGDEPISLSEAKKHLRVTSDDEDTLILGYLAAAREWVENYTGLILKARRVTSEYRCFGEVRLRWYPLAADPALTVDYRDTDGTEATLAGARFSGGRTPRLIIANAPQVEGESVRVSYNAGYASAEDVPASLKAAILLILGSLYEQREDDVIGVSHTATKAAENLSRPYRVFAV